MKVVTLIENTTLDKKLESAHGLSLYIETEEQKILFDCGPNNSFYNNALKLGVDLSLVDYLIISHYHNDHSGGLNCFLEINKHAKIIISDRAFDDYYLIDDNGQRKINLLNKELMANKRIILINNYYKIDNHSFVVGKLDYKFDNSLNNKFHKMLDNKMIQDDFSHEIALVIKEGSKTILVSGCFHSGVKNIADNITTYFNQKITHIIGGFHLQNSAGNKVSDELFNELKKYLLNNKIKCYTGHCTGEVFLIKIKNILKVNFNYISTGSYHII